MKIFQIRNVWVVWVGVGWPGGDRVVVESDLGVLTWPELPVQLPAGTHSGQMVPLPSCPCQEMATGCPGKIADGDTVHYFDQC